MSLFLNEISFHGVDVQVLVDNPNRAVARELKIVFETLMKERVIQPLPSTIFNADEIEKAYRFEFYYRQSLDTLQIVKIFPI